MLQETTRLFCLLQFQNYADGNTADLQKLPLVDPPPDTRVPMAINQAVDGQYWCLAVAYLGFSDPGGQKQ